jgi:hypothetical protein
MSCIDPLEAGPMLGKAFAPVWNDLAHLRATAPLLR